MDIMATAKQAFSTIRSHKYLLFFGFFVASGGAAGARGPHGTGHHGGTIPAWVWALVAGAAVLGVAALVMHVLSEAALIDGVERAQRGERSRIGEALRGSAPRFWTLVAIKLALGLALVASVAIVAAPLGGGLLHVYPVAAGAVMTVLLALPALPWLLTLYFIYMYALRIAVLDRCGAAEAVRGAKRFLHGRIAVSLKLLVAGGVGAAAVEVAGAVVALPLVAIGFGIYFAAGLVPAVVVGALLVAPVGAVVAGSVGAYRSSLWTIGYLESRQAI